MERIKSSLLSTYANYNSLEIPYNEEEVTKASLQIKELFDKISNMVVYRDGFYRKLNNLEIFVAIYEFVSNRVFVEEQKTSYDLIGTLITNKGVCKGYCELMSFLCESLNIPFLYKKSEVVNKDGISPLYPHANFEVIVQDNNGFNHCLHCDPAIDSPKEEAEIMGLNALLIHDTDINKYYHKQVPSGSDISNFYNNFLSEQNFESSILLLNKVNFIEQMTSSKNDKEIIDDHFIELRNNLIELNKFFKINIDFDFLNHDQLIEAYKTMYEYYVSIAQPINSEELKEAIINVKTAEIMYKNQLEYEKAQKQSQKIFEQRMKKSIDLQKKYWDNDNGVSLMFVEVNKKSELKK